MEQKDIVFDKGIHREPSVSLSDAELSECINLMPSHGELVNMRPAETIKKTNNSNEDLTLEVGEKLLAIHEVDGEKHYITHYTNGGVEEIHWMDKNSGHHVMSVSAANIKQVVAVGNVLALIYDNTANTLTPMKYLLWKNGAYKLLEDMPDVHMNFSLSGKCYHETYTQSVEFVDSNEDPTAYGNEICTLTSPDYNTPIYLSGTSFTAKGLANNTYYHLINNSTFIVKVITGDGQGDNYRTIKPGMDIFMEFKDEILKIGSEGLFTEGFQAAISVTVKGKSSTIENNAKVLKSTLDNYTAMMGDVKNFIYKVSTKENRFMFPFFVRYAIKMFDGSYCHISEPVLMLPNTGIVPVLTNTGANTVTCSAFIADLKAKITLTATKLLEWKDLITGVTVAITNPIYRLNQGEEWDQYSIQGEVKDYLGSSIPDNYGYLDGAKKSLWSEISSKITTANLMYLPPSFTKEQFKDNLISTSVFYIIKTYSIDDIISANGNNITIDFSTVKLDNIATLPVLPDEYNSASKFYPQGGFSYNNRLNIYNIKETLSKPYTPCSPIISISQTNSYKYIFYISNIGKEVAVMSNEFSFEPEFRWIYYGNPKATKCRIYKKNASSYQYADITLATHPWLNGAYAYNENELQWKTGSSTDYNANMETASNLIYSNNAIYASNASNPFYFAVDNQNLIGTGKINAVSTAAKALSQGQFGQFPLYAFTDDGIWSLSVDGNGKYSTSNPVNRDVVTNIKSICQIDDSVIYACSQGLKQLAGSDTKLLSDAIEGRNINESQFLSGLDTNHSGLVVNDTDSIIKMLDNCMIMYDPSGMRLLHIYPETANGKHYVYDLDNGEWSTEVGDSSKAKAVVPGYPYSTFVAPIKDASGAYVDKLMQYTNAENNNTVRYGLLLTREYAMGDPFAMKIIDDLRMIYSNNNNSANVKCKIGVFVSNDRKKWTLLKSLRKHSYKWYRFRIQTALTDLDALTSLSLRVEDRRTNKMR